MLSKEPVISQLDVFFLPELSSMIWQYLDFRPFVEYMTQKYFYPAVGNMVQYLNTEAIISQVQPRLENAIELLLRNRDRYPASCVHAIVTEEEFEKYSDEIQDQKLDEYYQNLPNLFGLNRTHNYFLYFYDFYGLIDDMFMRRSGVDTSVHATNAYDNFDLQNNAAYTDLFRFALGINDYKIQK